MERAWERSGLTLISAAQFNLMSCSPTQFWQWLQHVSHVRYLWNRVLSLLESNRLLLNLGMKLLGVTIETKEIKLYSLITVPHESTAQVCG